MISDYNGPKTLIQSYGVWLTCIAQFDSPKLNKVIIINIVGIPNLEHFKESKIVPIWGNSSNLENRVNLGLSKIFQIVISPISMIKSGNSSIFSQNHSMEQFIQWTFPKSGGCEYKDARSVAQAVSSDVSDAVLAIEAMAVRSYQLASSLLGMLPW